MSITPSELAGLSRCYCLPADRQRAAWLYLLTVWANARPTDGPILSNGAGGFCQLEVNVNGEVGAHASAGPATSPIPVIADGSGGFRVVVTNSNCERGTDPSAGPATAMVLLTDPNGAQWKLVVDSAGDLTGAPFP